MLVVVIDDEECIRDSLRDYLEGEGHHVITTGVAPQGCLLETASCSESDCRVDALIVDQHLGTTKGLDYLSQLPANGCGGRIGKKIVVSGMLSGAERDQAQQLGCDVAQKPWTFAQVERWLRQPAVKK